MPDNQSKVVRDWALAGMLSCFALMTPDAGMASDINVMTTPFPPYVVYDDTNGEVSGPAVDVINSICVSSGYNCHVRVEPWARAYATALEEPDTFIFSIARRPDRETQFKWIGTVAPYHVRLFSLRDYSVPEVTNWRELRSYHVAGQMADVKAQFLGAAGFDVVEAPSAEATIRMLYAGRAMLVAGDALSLPYRVNAMGIGSERLMVVANIPELSTELYLAASLATSDVLVESFQQALVALKRDGQYERIWALSSLAPVN